MSLLDYVSKVQIGNGAEVPINDDDAVQMAELFDLVYPVGSIYMSVNNVNPGTLFGGTWEAWGAGRVPVGVNTSDTDFNTVEKTGGAKSHSYTPAGTNSGGAVQGHTLTIAEMPNHSHNANAYYYNNSAQSLTHFAVQSGVALDTGKITSEGAGGGGAHNHGFTQPTFTGTAATMSHLQPYITCYMWKRTA